MNKLAYEKKTIYRKASNEIIKNVVSFDFTSSYPYVMTTCKFPATKFTRCYIKDVKQMAFIQ